MRYILSILKNLFLDRLMLMCSKLGVSRKMRLGEIEISLPADHKLIKYMKSHVKYDAFLPHLCSYLPPKSFIIDIGANVGDTLAGIVSKNPDLKICCIEPDQEFMKYLRINIQEIKRTFPQADIKALPYLIGLEFSNISLMGNGGTKHAIPGGGKLQTVQLDYALHYSSQRIALIKSDVDGFDFDVINSGLERIQTDKPLIFMEFYLQSWEDLENYMNTSKKLQSIGYTRFAAFDNFGGMILKSSEFQTLEHLGKYAINGRLGKSTRTIDYLDILFFTEKDEIERILESY